MFCLSFSFNFGFLTKLELIFSIWINVVFCSLILLFLLEYNFTLAIVTMSNTLVLYVGLTFLSHFAYT